MLHFIQDGSVVCSAREREREKERERKRERERDREKEKERDRQFYIGRAVHRMGRYLLY